MNDDLPPPPELLVPRKKQIMDVVEKHPNQPLTCEFIRVRCVENVRVNNIRNALAQMLRCPKVFHLHKAEVRVNRRGPVFKAVVYNLESP